MSFEINQGGDDNLRRPRTCRQTGNNAVQFDWVGTPVGRFGRCFAHCVAHVESFTDDYMAKRHKFPPAGIFEYHANIVIPWFGPFYNEYRKQRAIEVGFIGKLEKFNGGDLENRVRYEFVRPGKKGRPREYGISTENYLTIGQQKRKEVWERCSTEVIYRIKRRLIITLEEAREWGA